MTWENNLEVLLVKSPYKKGELAELVECSRNTITALCKGADPHLCLAYRIANVLKVSVYDIWPNFRWPDKEPRK